MDILDKLLQADTWEEFLRYKKERAHLDRGEESVWRSFIDEKKYLELPGSEDIPLPLRQEINKSGSTKKRVVYSYPEPFNSVLKGVSYLLYEYDGEFCDSCYAFRRNRSAGDALRRFHAENAEGRLWCLKADISDYFNSIDIGMLLDLKKYRETADTLLCNSDLPLNVPYSRGSP